MGLPKSEDRASGQFGDLKVRAASGVVLALAAGGFTYAGGGWIVALAMIAALAMMLEWRSITLHAGRPCGLDVVPFVIAVLGALVVLAFADIQAALIWLVAAAVTGLAVDTALKRPVAGGWALLGALYIGSATLALVALRGVEPFGFQSILWAALVVVAADVGGYFAGRLIGGPKLWPAVSPKKTWSGLGGAVLLAFLVGGVFSWATTGTYFYQVCTVSSLAALLAQGGDLAESALKRRFGVKDASALIPGHGGVLDRLDGHMIAILVACLVTFSRGQAVFIW